MNELNEIKAKYPLAVDALKQNKYAFDRGMVILGNGQFCLYPKFLLNDEQGEDLEDQVGEMLAELLNLIAKP